MYQTFEVVSESEDEGVVFRDGGMMDGWAAGCGGGIGHGFFTWDHCSEIERWNPGVGIVALCMRQRRATMCVHPISDS